MIRLTQFIMFALLFSPSCNFKTDGYVESIGNGYKLYYAHKSVDLLNDRNVPLIKDIWGYVKDDSFLIAYRNIIGEGTKDPIQYWLVKANSDSAYGPFNSSEFEKERSKFDVKPSLILDFARDSVVRY